jgi:hypothetical protein
MNCKPLLKSVINCDTSVKHSTVYIKVIRKKIKFAKEFLYMSLVRNLIEMRLLALEIWNAAGWTHTRYETKN